MTWNAKAGIPRMENDIYIIGVTLTDDASGNVVTRDFRFSSAQDFDQFPLRVAQFKTTISDLHNAASAFTPGPVADPKPSDPLTQEQQAQQNFLTLLNDWRSKRDELDSATKAGVATKLTPQDVATAQDAWKQVYIDAYAPFLKGLV